MANSGWGEIRWSGNPGTVGCRVVDLGILRETAGRQRGRFFAYGRCIDILSRGTEPLPP